MSEEALKEVIDQLGGEQVEDKPEIEPEIEQEQTNPEVEKASHDGWKPKEDWVEAGNDPDDWVSAKKFNERGSMMGQIKSLKSQVESKQSEFEKRLESVNKLHEVQQKQLLTDLEAKRNNAIEEADVESVNKIQGQIDDLKTDEPEPDTSGKPTEMLEWEAKNEWISDVSSPKAGYAQMRWNVHVGQGKSVAEALAAIDEDVAKAFPPTNERRNNAPAQEGGKSRPGKRAEVKLQWSDLTRDEERYYHPDAWKTKEDYLQAVADVRKGEK